MKNGNEPINPTYLPNKDIDFIGLSKREYFAAMAMQGLLSNSNVLGDHNHDASEWIATHSVKQADALLFELEKQQP